MSNTPMSGTATPQIIGRYALYDVIASGGMASVHIGRLIGPVGFARTVAIKRLHPNFACDPEFVAMLLDEARLAARIRHPNVVPTLDIVAEGKEILLVMEYVVGESLMHLLRSARTAGQATPVPVVVDIMVGVLNGLHAAHEATDERGDALNIVHRDVSPHNILVGTDGSARVLDFGIAKASNRIHQTQGSQVKGKLRYMPAEQMLGRKVTRAADIYSASVVLWEALAGRRFFDVEHDAEVMYRVLEAANQPPSSVRRDIPRELDEIVMRGMSKNPDDRYPTAKAMANALEAAAPAVTRSAVSEWVFVTVGRRLEEREERVAAVERTSSSVPAMPEHEALLPRRTLTAPLRDSTLSRAGSISHSVSPAAMRASIWGKRLRQRLTAVGALALLAGAGLATAIGRGLRSDTRPAWTSASAPVASGNAAGAPAPVVSQTNPVKATTAAPVSADSPPASTAGSAKTSAPQSQLAAAVPATTKAPKRVARPATTARTPALSSTLYRRE
jgi:serine/threonine-protein kinase